jgi:hypothetical protein
MRARANPEAYTFSLFPSRLRPHQCALRRVRGGIGPGGDCSRAGTCVNVGGAGAARG